MPHLFPIPHGLFSFHLHCLHRIPLPIMQNTTRCFCHSVSATARVSRRTATLGELLLRVANCLNRRPVLPSAPVLRHLGLQFQHTPVPLFRPIANGREKSKFSESLKSKHEETEAYLSEIETIGQAYDDMQTQNQQLLQEITERDEYNIKLVIDGIKARQQQDSSTSENQSLEKTIQETNALCSFYELKTAKIDDQLRACSEQAQRLAEDRVQNRAALESAEMRLIDVRKASQQQRVALEELQSKVDKSRIHLSDLQIDLEKERFERKRAEEEVEALRRKITRLRSEIEGSSVIQKHRQMLKKYKEILNCGVCHDRRKEVVVTKCYHLFCNPCILKLIESRNRKCPFCATTFAANDVKPVYI